MSTKKSTISVRVDDETKRQVVLAAKLAGQSAGAFLGKTGEACARQVLLDWAVAQHRRGDATFSELAQQTGLAVEEIMEAMGRTGGDEALEAFLASCRTVAEMHKDPDFLRMAEEAVDAVRGGERTGGR